MKKPDPNSLIAYTCSIVVMITAMAIFTKNIFPLIANNEELKHNLSLIDFDVNIIVQTICSYFLLILGALIASRSRVCWIASIFLLSTCLISNLLIAEHYHYTDITPILVALGLLTIFYRHFNLQLYLSYSFVLIGAFLVFVISYGTLGSYLLRDEFSNLQTLGDAFYFTIVTFSTVGFGDILPKTHLARYFVSSMIIIGLLVFTSGITFIGLVLNSKVKKLLTHFNKGKIGMTNHMILMGYNSIMTKILIESYEKKDIPYVVIDETSEIDSDRQLLLDQNKLLKTSYPGNHETLIQARLSEAKMVIVGFDRDADTIFAIMNIKEFLAEYTKRPKILARVFYRENIEKAKIVGADKVIAPHLMVADAIISYSIDD